MSAEPADLDTQRGGAVSPITAAASLDVTTKRGSLLEDLRREYKRETGERQAKITIPETHGKLVAVYRWIDPSEEGQEIGDRVAAAGGTMAEQTVAGAMDTLIAACEGFYLRDPETGELILIDEDGRGACRYDARLVAALNLDVPVDRARDIVLAVFSNNKQAMIDHFIRLSRWFADTTSDADRAFFGGA